MNYWKSFGAKTKLNSTPQNHIEGERLRCIGRRVSKPRLFHYTHDHRAMAVDVDGYPAVCIVIKEWSIRRK